MIANKSLFFCDRLQSYERINVRALDMWLEGVNIYPKVCLQKE